MEEQFIQTVTNLGLATIFLYMLVKLWSDYKTLQNKYFEDLRDIAGLRQRMERTQDSVRQWRNSQDMLDDTVHSRPRNIEE